MADANRQCEAVGLHSRTFESGYTAETGNEKELELAGNGGLFVEIAYNRYVSIEEVREDQKTSKSDQNESVDEREAEKEREI